MDEVHFVATNKKSQFKIKMQVGPFLGNTKVAGEEANKLLKEMQLFSVLPGLMIN